MDRRREQEAAAPPGPVASRPTTSSPRTARGAHGAAPGVPSSPQALIALQSTAGNRAVRRMLQVQRAPESTTSKPNEQAGSATSSSDPGLSDLDRFKGMANAAKLATAISEAGKYSGADLDKEMLTPSKLAKSTEAPEQMVKDAGSNWSKVKAAHLHDEATMRRILQYRVTEVGRVYGLVIAQMHADNKAVHDRELAKPVGERDLSQVFQLNDLQFSMMGSTDLTSDYDVSFDHVVTKPWVGAAAVKLFNKKFREKWGKESGTVFDTNVYTQGFMPQDMSNIPAGMPNVLAGRAERAEKRGGEAVAGSSEQREFQDLAKRLRGESEKAKAARKEAAQKVTDERSTVRVKDDTSEQAVFAVEDLMSMVKLRKFMSDAEWAKYSILLLESIPVRAFEATHDVLQQADRKFKELDQKLQHTKAGLRTQKKQKNEAVDEGDLELEASNRLYEQYLDSALAIVLANKNRLQGDALKQWTEEQSTALYFANEAYHTSGPVESTVIGQQMGIAMEQKGEQHLQAVNEQTGFVIEQHHAAHGNQGKFLWKSAKYVDRICAVVAAANQNPKHFAVLKALSSELLKIKKSNLSDEEKNRQSSDTLERIAPGADVRTMVVELNADLNQRLRRTG